MTAAAVLAFLIGYGIGSVPFGLLLARATGRGDLRQAGSGNIGATNALRVGGPWLGAGTLLLDAGKGAAAVLLGASLGPAGALAGGAGAFLGHLFSPWLGFRGGKGVATMIGVTAAVLPLAGLANAATWAAAAFATRLSSVAGMSGAVASAIAAIALREWQAAALFAAMAALLIQRHRANLARLRAGTEPRIGAK